ncbi:MULTISPECIES: NUDIX hydrolase [Micromonospora]|uniref:NUDIX domain-containing protein n=1 Tax=Micromonospora solifontis TaxID=2487138 RepID=A0ABX9WI97_9ACTN|nr:MULTISPECIES: NUDIX domain-containing protein [Micromonospora]NES12208.1 NUDIX domain-containing protein [Micromonospora sp. PPF5-17B]NES36990.1 NUDIX domain-containing protein [Micromonospora solifontis]NES54309.1 NUDIX domain-containing protein [Micromonospora sp. PPF5-6]RNL98907.1 NUDIX domain-containing protein [Micromonospora solifontis]
MRALRWAVAAVVVDQAGRVLLCRQAGAGRRWALPGGRLRHDESPAEAAVREIRAETGWEVDLLDLVGLYRLGVPDAPPPPAGRCGVLPDVLVHVFRARVRADAPVTGPAVGCHLDWHPPDALPAAQTPTTRAALADALAGRSGVLRAAAARLPAAGTAPMAGAEPVGGTEPAGGTEALGTGTPPGQRAAGERAGGEQAAGERAAERGISRR